MDYSSAADFGVVQIDFQDFKTVSGPCFLTAAEAVLVGPARRVPSGEGTDDDRLSGGLASLQSQGDARTGKAISDQTPAPTPRLPICLSCHSDSKSIRWLTEGSWCCICSEIMDNDQPHTAPTQTQAVPQVSRVLTL